MSPIVYWIIVSSILKVSLVGSQEISSTARWATHGEHCNKTVRCDTSAYLSCSQATSICECQKVDGMFYDSDIKSCLVLVGVKCRYPLIKRSKDDNGELFSRDPHILEDELACVRNSFCNQSGFCMCAADYVGLGNGTCITRRNLGESCASDGECRQDQLLMCIDGQCSCNDSVATYNYLTRQCVGKAGKPCLESAACVYNAECLDSSASYLAFTKRRMRRSFQLCSCNPGFVTDQSGFCKVGLGGQCSETKLCANDFQCRDGICRCPYENVQITVQRSQMCVSKIGGPCNETTTSLSAPSYMACPENAYCGLVNNSYYECRCNEDGYVVNDATGTCDLAYGSVCNVLPFGSSESDTDASDPSDRTSWNQGPKCGNSLFCINNICACESLLYDYNLDYGKCLGKVGARCEIGKVNLVDVDGNVGINPCISGAECKPSQDIRPPYGKCQCSNGFSVTTNRTCI